MIFTSHFQIQQYLQSCREGTLSHPTTHQQHRNIIIIPPTPKLAQHNNLINHTLIPDSPLQLNNLPPQPQDILGDPLLSTLAPYPSQSKSSEQFELLTHQMGFLMNSKQELCLQDEESGNQSERVEEEREGRERKRDRRKRGGKSKSPQPRTKRK